MSLRFETMSIPSADFHGESSLPPLKTLNLFNREFYAKYDDDDELFLSFGPVNNAFPYRSQDMYDRTLSPKDYQVAVLENKYLKAVFMPDFGGKLWSLYDKQQGKDLLFTNDCVRPCNLAVRNAWMSGGVEWNGGFFGHCPFTCSPINTAVTCLDDGTEVLRFYYFERVRRAVIQMDFFLPEESRMLLARIRVTNPNDTVIPMYWWSNIGVVETDESRVVVPADEYYSVSEKGVYKTPVTEDNLYPVRTPFAKDYFWKTREDTRRYICQVDKEGYGLCQTSTARLKGRKLFVWGNIQGGHRWMNYLSSDESEGRYSEIQCGLARTQFECLPMPPRTAWEWIEAYGAMQADPKKVHGDMHTSRQEVEQKLDAMMSADALEELLKSTKPMAVSPAKQVIGIPENWGALEILRKEKSGIDIMNGHLDFGAPGQPQEPWLRLMQDGTMGEFEPQDIPQSYMLDENFEAMLAEAVQGKDEKNWYAHYQYGVSCYIRKAYTKAKEHLLRSIELHDSPWANYALSMTYGMLGDTEQELTHMLHAHKLCNEDISLAKELLGLLCTRGNYADVIDIFESATKEIQENGRCQFCYATALAHSGKPEAAEAVLIHDGRCIVVPDVRESEVSISDLWFKIQDMKKAAHLPYHQRTEIPWELDFRMKADPET